MDRLDSLIEELAAEDRSWWSGPARCDRAIELVDAAERLTREALRALGDADRDRAWEGTGAASAVAWVADAGAMTRGEASAKVRQARVARDHEAIGTALAAGAITTSHLRQLTALSKHRAGTFDDHVPVLVEAATAVAPQDFATIASRWRALADDHTTLGERVEPEWLDHAITFGGAYVMHATYATARGAALHQAIEARSKRRDSSDARTAAERRADALYEMVFGSDTVYANIDVIVDVDTLVGRERPLADVRREIRGVGAIDAVVMARLACDAHVGRILVRNRSAVLDVGRRSRVATPPQRRAVMIRDETCVWPGCRRPSHQCEVHHDTPWIESGETNVDEMHAVCGRHHTMAHQGWKISFHDDGTTTVAPP